MAQIRITHWTPSPASKAGLCFYPTTKFVGNVFDDTGKFIAETGKCATRAAAWKAAERITAKVSA